MKLDSNKLHTDIIKKLNAIKISQREFCKKRNLSRSTISRIGNNKPITIETLFKIVEWLDKDINEYIIYEHTRYRSKRIIKTL